MPMARVMPGRRTIRVATWLHTPALPLPWMFHGSSLGRLKTPWKVVRLTASRDSRMDSSAGSRVSPAIRITPIAIANGMPRSE